MSNAIKNAMARRGMRFETPLALYAMTGVFAMMLAVLAVAIHSPALLGIACALGLAFIFGTFVFVFTNAGSISIKPETAVPPRPYRSSVRTFSIPIDHDLAEDVLNSCTEQELKEAAASLRRASDSLKKAAERVERHAEGRPE